MVFHIWLRFRHRADAKPHSNKAIILVKSAAVGIDLKRVQPEMFGRETASMVEQSLANTAPLKIGVNKKLIRKIARDGEKAHHATAHIGHPDIIVLQNHVSEIIAIFREGVSLLALKIRERQFPSRARQPRHRIEIIERVRMDNHFGIVL